MLTEDEPRVIVADISSEQSAHIMKFRQELQNMISSEVQTDSIKPIELKREPRDASMSSSNSEPEPMYEEEIKTSAFHIVPDEKKRGRGRPPKHTLLASIKLSPPRILRQVRRPSPHFLDDSPTSKSSRKRGRPIKMNHILDQETVYECSRCEYKTATSFDLELHYKSHNENAFPCPYCTFMCSQKGNLITHMRTHTKEKPFRCMFCDFAASQKVNLQVHIRVHTKEKPFKCQFCDFAAAQKCNLITHVTRRHSNVQTIDPNESYSCTNLWSSENDNQKSYKCGNCNFRCKLKNEMFSHVKTNHPLADLVTCDFKSLLF